MMEKVISDGNLSYMSGQHLTLREWNRELQLTLIVNDIVLVLFLVFGIVGNSLVLYVYKFKIGEHDGGSVRHFIVDLSFVDLLATITCSTSDLAMNLMPATYYYTELCKCTWVFNTFLTGMSVFILIIISIHRYFKICNPFGPFFTRERQRIFMVVSSILAIVLSIPPGYIYGAVPFTNKYKNITGYRCSILKSGHLELAFSFGIFLLSLAIVIITALVMMYVRIGYVLHRHFRRMSTFKESALDARKQYNLPKSDTGNSEEQDHNKNPLRQSRSDSHTETPDSSQNLFNRPKSKLDKTDHDFMLRFTIMFVMITIVFIVCYATKATIMILESLDPRIWEKYTDKERAVITFVYNLYILSYVINPVIFAIFDTRFKTHLYNMVSRCC